MTRLEINHAFCKLPKERQEHIFGFLCGYLSGDEGTAALERAMLSHPRYDAQFTPRKDKIRIYDREHPGGRPQIVVEFYEPNHVEKALDWLKSHQ